MKNGTAMANAALDLSSKPMMSLAIHETSRHPLLSECLSSSERSIRHPSSSSSSDDDSESSTHYSAINPVPGPVQPTITLDTQGKSSNVMSDEESHSLQSSPSTPKSANVSGLLRDYPVEFMPSVYSSPSSLMAGQMGALTSPISIGLGLLSKFPRFSVTSLTSHLLQKQRRTASRSSSQSAPDNSDKESKKLKHVPEEKKDDSYWERRRKNNDAAKRSRDSRRQKEEEIAIRTAYLEQENLQLQAQIAFLKNETVRLYYMLSNRL